MKKLIPIVFTLVSALPAATILCTPEDQAINGGAASVSCPGAVATPGFLITGITLEVVGSWQDSSFGFSGTSNYAFTENSPDFGLTPPPLSGDAAGGNNGSTGILSLGPVAVSLASVSGFTVDAVRTVTVGSTPNSATVSVRYITTETEQRSTVPEPASMALLGSALLGLGFVARRRK